MENFGKFIPRDAPKEWILFHDELFPKISAIKVLAPGTMIVLDQANATLSEAGFQKLSVITDVDWIVRAALVKNPKLPLYPITFCKMISDCIANERKNFVWDKINQAKSKYPNPSKNQNDNNNAGGSTRIRIGRQYSKKKLAEILEYMKNKVISPCYACHNNSAKELYSTSCCGILIHYPCWGDFITRLCPNCKKMGSIQERFNSIESVFMKSEDYENYKKSEEDAKKDEKQKMVVELEKALENFTPKEIEELLAAKHFKKLK